MSYCQLKYGEIFNQFTAGNKQVTLRSPKWEDLDSAIEFINGLVSERDEDPGFGIISDKKQTRESEAVWLANEIASIEKDTAIHVVAEVDGKMIGNCQVSRGKWTDEFHHGFLGISVSKPFRNSGIGRKLIETAIEQCRKADFKTIELEVFANNSRASHLYESVGFKQVGVIPKKIFRNGKFYDIILMSIVL
jgi:ribosomal protein S18 acetylase RimI-like enzyme